MLFTVDPEKCRHDGLCAAVCPPKIIIQEGQETPRPIENAEEICIACGHCVAVCPHAALTHRDMKIEDCPPVRPELKISAEQAEQFLRARRSIRVYKDETVPRETLSRLIRLARFAPSGHNSQPVEWLVLEKAADVLNVAALTVDFMRLLLEDKSPLAIDLRMDRVVEAWAKGVDRVCRRAPHLIIAHAHKDNLMAPTSATIALSYLELAAFSLGLGACWAGYVQAAATFHPPLGQALRLPDGHLSLGAMMVGYPQYKYQRLPLRREPKVIWR
ncbi:MAG: nitroreductase family protein [Thermodesulfobacteriota bacterium]